MISRKASILFRVADPPLLPFIGADQREQSFEAVAFGGTALWLGTEIRLDFRQRGVVIGFAVDWAKIVHGECGPDARAPVVYVGCRNRRSSATKSFGLSPWTVWPAL